MFKASTKEILSTLSKLSPKDKRDISTLFHELAKLKHRINARVTAWERKKLNEAGIALVNLYRGEQWGIINNEKPLEPLTTSDLDIDLDNTTSNGA